VAAVALAAAVIGGLVAGASIYVLAGDDGGPAQSGPTAQLTVQQTSAVTDVARKARPGVVKIESSKRTNQGTEKDVGSGVVLDNAGHILTNAHVVMGAGSLTVTLSDGTQRPAILVGADYPFTDIAVLQIGPTSVTPIPIGDSAKLVLGETVIAIGNPLGDFDGTVSVGVVSGLNRRRTFDAVRQDDLIQTDAAVNNGSSGGALLNLTGQFVGMPTAILRQSQSGQAVEGIAFALPANRIIAIANRIIAENASYPRPSLGLSYADLSPEILSRLPRQAVQEGARVNALDRGGPAEAAGIFAGDIITRIGDQDVNLGNPLFNALLNFEPGQTAKVVLNRNGRIIEAEVRLGKQN
jgi:2-alkenal reductase